MSNKLEGGRALDSMSAGVFYNIGVDCFEKGEFTQAAAAYRQAADLGLAQAQANLGLMYANGQGVTKDYSEAIKLFTLAAEQGFPDGQFKLGIMYANGWGVTQNNQKALDLVRRAAKSGHPDAMAALSALEQRS